ncbi:MAG: BrnT family toxin [Chloroflexi bacterium]|nr:BrnT family toxin [Chloroflexota bacterium]
MVIIRRLIWDPWNVAHIADHQVIPEEVEEVCHGRPMTSTTLEDRLRVVGPTLAGRMLTVILAAKEEGVYYLVTARPASRKERRLYQQREGG